MFAARLALLLSWTARPAASTRLSCARGQERHDTLSFIREIESEIRRLTHELEIARQSGCDPRALDMGEVETHLAALRRIIKGEA